MNKDFADFQKEFKEYQQKFGLTGYRVYFEAKPIKNYFAEIEISHDAMTATARFNSALPDSEQPFKDVKRNAKHEAIHLLVGRLSGDARYRYASEQEIDEAEEELVHKLEDLIP